MIKVNLKLSGLLRNQYRSTPLPKGEDARLKTDSTVADLLVEYGIEPRTVHMIVINRKRADYTTTLKDGDEVRILPLAAGG